MKALQENSSVFFFFFPIFTDTTGCDCTVKLLNVSQGNMLNYSKLNGLFELSNKSFRYSSCHVVKSPYIVL